MLRIVRNVMMGSIGIVRYVMRDTLLTLHGSVINVLSIIVKLVTIELASSVKLGIILFLMGPNACHTFVRVLLLLMDSHVLVLLQLTSPTIHASIVELIAAGVTPMDVLSVRMDSIKSVVLVYHASIIASYVALLMTA